MNTGNEEVTSPGPAQDEAQIRARCERATSGPWDWARPEGGGPAFITAPAQFVLEGRRNDSNDAEFIANARQDVPHLLDQLTASRQMLNERMEGARAEITDLRVELEVSRRLMREARAERDAALAKVAAVEKLCDHATAPDFGDGWVTTSGVFAALAD